MERRERKREEEREVFLDMSHVFPSVTIYVFNSGFHEWSLNVTQMATLNDRLLSISSILSKKKM